MGRTTQNHSRRGQQGFTLIELLVVIAILAILAGVAVVAMSTASQNAAASACRAEGRVVVTAIEAARLDNARHEYPGVAGPDGLDAVRVAGLLQWGQDSTYWAYVNPAQPPGLTDSDLVRSATDRVSAQDCKR
ncbi:MAG: type II secretion system protein [Actinobacteria bacterium]|nr:type II secretion system protein [Actinomycetota bacterium]